MSLKKYSTARLLQEVLRREQRADEDSRLIGEFVQRSTNYSHAVLASGEIVQLQPMTAESKADFIAPEDDAFNVLVRPVSNDEIMDKFIDIATRQPKDVHWVTEGTMLGASAPIEIAHVNQQPVRCVTCGDLWHGSITCRELHPELWCTACGESKAVCECSSDALLHCPIHNIALLGDVCHQCERETEESEIVADSERTMEIEFGGEPF